MHAEHAEVSFLHIDLIASANLQPHRLVTQSGEYPAPGGLAFGITRTAMAERELGPVDVYAFTKAEAGAAFSKDVPLMAGADGTVVAHDGDGSNFPIGRSMSDAQAGEVVRIWLIPCVGLPVNAA